MAWVCQGANGAPLRFVGAAIAILLAGATGLAQSSALAADVETAQSLIIDARPVALSTAAPAVLTATEVSSGAATVETVLVSALAMQFPDFTVKNEDARAPIGWEAFCAEYQQECRSRPEGDPRVVKLTQAVWSLLVDTNRRINNAISWRSDMRHWGRVNVWTYPTDGYGDCKDYALEKQRVLLQGGLPREDLLLTVVWTRANEGHAVLIVRTDKGDYVLDNLSPRVLPWHETNLDFVKRQSQADPNAWVYIDGYHRRDLQVASTAQPGR